MKNKNIILLSIVVLTFITCSNCSILVKGKLVPKITNLPQNTKKGIKPRVSIHFDYKGLLSNPKFAKKLNKRKREVLVSYIDELNKKTDLFQYLSNDSITNNVSDFKIGINMHRNVNFNPNLKLIASSLSLSIIPYKNKIDSTLTAKILNANGKEIKTYHYYDCEKTYTSIFLLPVSIFNIFKRNPDDINGYGIEKNLIKNFFNDLIKDDILSRS